MYYLFLIPRFTPQRPFRLKKHVAWSLYEHMPLYTHHPRFTHYKMTDIVCRRFTCLLQLFLLVQALALAQGWKTGDSKNGGVMSATTCLIKSGLTPGLIWPFISRKITSLQKNLKRGFLLK